ncbi:unnamed protein product [Prorocentrum cordatum]|uniref:WW domain-containing protein n=1 Tax=Prorocentrum cordatum TaxID=2364126 RepID=A0ABN9SD62_9DINO|nr:unnamed protein product [Polarella glacialis]
MAQGSLTAIPPFDGAGRDNSAEAFVGIAEMIGMDIKNEPQFLWIAEEASRAAVPPDWKELVNEDGETLYYHTRTTPLWGHGNCRRSTPSSSATRRSTGRPEASRRGWRLRTCQTIWSPPT